MSSRMGAGTTDARIVSYYYQVPWNHYAVKENIYMQCFLGLPSFKKTEVFAPSLFVEIRKRLGLDYRNKVNDIIVKHNLPDKNVIIKLKVFENS